MVVELELMDNDVVVLLDVVGMCVGTSVGVEAGTTGTLGCIGATVAFLGENGLEIALCPLREPERDMTPEPGPKIGTLVVFTELGRVVTELDVAAEERER